MQRLLFFVVTAVLAFSMSISADLVRIDMPEMGSYGLYNYFRSYLLNSTYEETGRKACKPFIVVTPKVGSVRQLVAIMNYRHGTIPEGNKNGSNAATLVFDGDPGFHYRIVKGDHTTITPFSYNWRRKFHHYDADIWKRIDNGYLIAHRGHYYKTIVGKQNVPESSMVVFLGLGLAGLPFIRRKKNTRSTGNSAGSFHGCNLTR